MVMVIDEIFDLEKKKQDEEIKRQTHQLYIQSTLDSLQMGQLKRIKELLDNSPHIKR